ncbi:MAG: hypothetical protein HRU38_06980 [Saccharospirillaceae bacterium]|nr:hypothetical protein [Saccharospirillaceae bacterium]
MSIGPKVEYVSTYEEVVYALAYLAKKNVNCPVTVDTENAQSKLNAFIGDDLNLKTKESLRPALRQFRLRNNVKSNEKVTKIVLGLPLSKSIVGNIMESLEIDKIDKNKFRCFITNLIKKEFE